MNPADEILFAVVRLAHYFVCPQPPSSFLQPDSSGLFQNDQSGAGSRLCVPTRLEGGGFGFIFSTAHFVNPA